MRVVRVKVTDVDLGECNWGSGGGIICCKCDSNETNKMDSPE